MSQELEFKEKRVTQECQGKICLTLNVSNLICEILNFRFPGLPGRKGERGFKGQVGAPGDAKHGRRGEPGQPGIPGRNCL